MPNEAAMRTAEEIRKQYRKGKLDLYNIKSVATIIDREMNCWIPCVERLPTEEKVAKEVLAHATASGPGLEHVCMLAHYDSQQNIWYWDEGDVGESGYRITHWQPLPAPPEES